MRSEWDEGQKAMLRKLWDEGHSASEIGRRMNMTKGAVIGKSQRMGLSGRGIPTQRESKFTPEIVAELRLLAKTSMTNTEIAARFGCSANWLGTKMGELGICRRKLGICRRAVRAPRRSHAPDKPIPEFKARQTGALKPRAFKATGRSGPCCWPIGTPGVDFRFCDAPSMIGRPYCEAHVARAYRDICVREATHGGV